MNEILSQSIFFGIAITLVTYEIGLWIKQKTGKAIANPLLISVILIVAVLLLFHIDYETYATGRMAIDRCSQCNKSSLTACPQLILSHFVPKALC